MVTEGRQGNIVVTKKLELKEENIINAKNKKDMQDIEKNIAKIVRDNEELDNTIKRIIEDGIEGNDDIIDMLSNMMMGARNESSSSSTRFGLLRRPKVGPNQCPQDAEAENATRPESLPRGVRITEG